MEVLSQDGERQLHHHHCHVLAYAASRAHPEGHVGEWFGREAGLPPLWVERLDVWPVFGAVLHDVFTEGDSGVFGFQGEGSESRYFFVRSESIYRVKIEQNNLLFANYFYS